MPVRAALRRHWLLSTLAALIVLPVAVVAAWAGITLNFTYSSGERAGYLQKISQRGWLCKTWEGELQLTAIPGAAPEIFAFSTRSDSLAAEINRLSGQRVVIHYQQHKGVPTSCFGDTEYFAVGVRLVDATSR